MTQEAPRLTECQLHALKEWFASRKTATLLWVVSIEDACRIHVDPVLRALDVVVTPVSAEPAEIEERPYNGTETHIFAPFVL